MTEHGYSFQVELPSESAETGVRSGETPQELVERFAFQKARDVALRLETAADEFVMVIGCDTIADCQGQVLGKPRDRKHAEEMLSLLRGREHNVHSGLCLWQTPDNRVMAEVETTRLLMDDISDAQLHEYLETGKWQGKAGGFGFQDGNDWLQVLAGSQSNVVGLPMERLATMLETFADNARYQSDY